MESRSENKDETPTSKRILVKANTMDKKDNQKRDPDMGRSGGR
jgi:hypothetical protein